MRGFRAAGLVAAASVGLGVATLAAQSPVEVGLGAGASIPLGATSQGLNTGWHALVLAEVRPWSSRVGIRVDAALQQLGFEGGGGNTQIADVTANVAYHFESASAPKLRPYLFGGVGVYRFKANSDFEVPPPQTKFGLDIGGGVEFEGLGTSLFIESRFSSVSVPSSDFRVLAVTAGFRLGGRGRRGSPAGAVPGGTGVGR
ncbi:MAG: outer membrane beta-barrel protein [Gemmatimonadales bacterium]